MTAAADTAPGFGWAQPRLAEDGKAAPLVVTPQQDAAERLRGARPAPMKAPGGGQPLRLVPSEAPGGGQPLRLVPSAELYARCQAGLHGAFRALSLPTAARLAFHPHWWLYLGRPGAP